MTSIMLRSTFRPAQFRPILQQNARFVLPHVRQPVGKRLSSTANHTAASSASASTLLAGVVGGLTAFVGGYAWYHISGTAKAISTARSTIESLESAKLTLPENIPATAEAALFIYNAPGNYLAAIPGDGPGMDRAFLILDHLADSRRDEFSRILGEACDELGEIIVTGGDMMDARWSETMKRMICEYAELRKDAGLKILAENPVLRSTLNGGFRQLRQLGKIYGPMAQTVVNETYNEVQELLDNNGINADSARKAANLVQRKTKEVQELGRRASTSAWEAMKEEVDSYLTKAPRVKEVLSEKAEELRDLVMQGDVSVDTLPKLVDKVRDIADSKEGGSGERVEQFQEMINDIVEKGRKKVANRRSRSKSGKVVEELESFSESSFDDDGKLVEKVEQCIRVIPNIDYVPQQIIGFREQEELNEKKGPEVAMLPKETMQEINEARNRRDEQIRKFIQEARNEAMNERQEQKQEEK